MIGRVCNGVGRIQAGRYVIPLYVTDGVQRGGALDVADEARR